MTDDSPPCDALLLRLPQAQPDLLETAQHLSQLPAWTALACRIDRGAWSDESQCAWLYLPLARRMPVSAETLNALQSCAGPHARVSRLELLQQLEGASHGQAAPFHYVVEMTPDPGFEDELQQWYDTEHLPGLARVPGCVLAQRWWNHDAGPKSLACYDLISAQTLGSPAWLAVRNTPWSAHMRPHFTQTRRTMFEATRNGGPP